MNLRLATWICLADALVASGPGLCMSHADGDKPSESPAPSKVAVSSEARPGLRAEIEQVRASAHSLGKNTPDSLDAMERGLRELRIRHPQAPEVYLELLIIADSRPGDSGLTLARELLDWPSSDLLKEKARAVVRKHELLGREYPIRLAGLDGRIWDSQQWRGKVVLIDFWATWCPPCREGLPKLKALLASRQPKGFEIFGINFDDSPKVLRRFVARESISWPQHIAAGGLEGAVAREFGLTRLPSLWLIDRNGRLRDLDAREDLESKVDRLLSEPNPTGASVPSLSEPTTH